MDTLERDEAEDKAFFKDTLSKEKNPKRIADRLTQRYAAKYSHEFRGVMKVETDPFGKWWTLWCGKDKKITFDQYEMKEIPERIRFFRELARK